MKKSVLILTLIGLIGCADTEKVTIDQRPNITNNYITEITQIIREEIKGATIVAFIHPCGLVGSNREIFMQLSTGQLVAVYDGDTTTNPDRTRLVQLAPGNYITTHSTPVCQFTITSDLQVNPSTKTEL